MAELCVAPYVYFVFCTCLLIANATPPSTSTAKPCSASGSCQTLTDTSTHADDDGHRLARLLGLRLGGKSEPLKPYPQDTVREKANKVINDTQTHRTHEGPSAALAHPNDIQLPQTERRLPQTDSSGQETLLVLLDNLSKEIRGIRSSFKTFDTEIASLKEKNSTISEQSTARCQSNGVGANYNPDKVIKTTNKILPKNCQEVQESGYNVSGIYEIRPRHSEKPFMVLCDMETNGGGWTHIQNRFDGSQDFFLEWRFYKFGFGDLEREFWLGLENIYTLTAFEVNELLIEIVDRDKKKAVARYDVFGIAPETDGYKLNVLRGFSGDAGDSLVQHFGSNFSTKDLDQDSHDGNCAELFKGGWWYKNCYASNLNGKYININLPVAYKFQGLHWLTFRGHEYCHAKSRMLVRPTQKSRK